MTLDDFEDENKITAVYLPELSKSLKAYLDASRVQIYDFVVRNSRNMGNPEIYLQKVVSDSKAPPDLSYT